ncbi:MAG TPA: 5'-nucleotidase C-terminal domain-containing protein [Desulfomonilaceae bacterium]|nr:5'-nucleotidase C-terminal domain-containing protein [Desulfomonilaceae bacterium]
MNTRIRPRVSFLGIFLILILVCALGIPAAVAQSSKPLKLTILYMNDPHAHYEPYQEGSTKELIGGFAKAQTVFKEVLAANRAQGRETLIFLAGDLLMGTPFSTAFKGRLGVKLMNKMNFTSMTVGNHEFDYGQANLLKTLKPMMKFPLLSANTTSESGKFLFQRSMQKKFPKSETRAVIFGLTTTDTAITTHPKNAKGLVFHDPIQTTRELLKKVKKDDLVIALTHLGVDEDKKLAQDCPRINVIIGGHSHTALLEPLRVGDTIICQAGAYAKYVGRLDMEVSEGHVTQYSGRLILLGPDVKPDEEIASIIGEHKKLMDDRLNEVIGKTEIFLDGTRSNIRSGHDTNLGRLVAYNMAASSGSDVAMINGGSIRASLKEGAITLNDIYTVLPFSNTVVTMNLTGKDLLAALARSADLEPGSGGKLQTFGIEYRIDQGAVKIDDIRDKGFDPEATYSVAVNDFLAAAGDGYTVFKERGKNVYDSSLLVSDLLIGFIKAKKVINPETLASMQ